MKPGLFDYESPTTVDEVLGLLSEHDDTALLAGGQSLIPLMNMRLARPEVVIDLNGVAELNRVEVTETHVTVGAGVRIGSLESNSDVLAALPVLATAASWVAHPQIRARSTMGGTLCHADPAAEMPTIAVALGAEFELHSQARGARTVAAEDFFESVFLTSKESDELLVSARFPRLAGYHLAYDEIARRHGDFPFVGLCLAVKVDNGGVTDARAAAAGVADKPARLPELEHALIGSALTTEVIEEAAAAAAAEVSPPDDAHGTAAFRRGLLRTLVRRLTNTMEAAA